MCSGKGSLRGRRAKLAGIETAPFLKRFSRGEEELKKTRTTKKFSASRKHRSDRDIEKGYPLPQFIEKLRRFADALATGKWFCIQIQHERIHVPARAIANIEHEREGDEKEIEFQLKWRSIPARSRRLQPRSSTGARARRSLRRPS